MAVPLEPAARRALRPGANTPAVHGRGGTRRHFFDLGLDEVHDAEARDTQTAAPSAGAAP